MKTNKFHRAPPASQAVIDALIAEVGIELPADYLNFLCNSNGGEGSLNIEPGWFQIWSAQEVMQLNRDYQVQRWLPFLFGFGSDGGGGLLAFDMRNSGAWSVCIVPLGDLSEGSLLVITSDFAHFVKAME